MTINKDNLNESLMDYPAWRAKTQQYWQGVEQEIDNAELADNCRALLFHSWMGPDESYAEKESYIFKFSNFKGEVVEINVNSTSYMLKKGRDTSIYKKEELWKLVNELKIHYAGPPSNPVLFTGAFNPPHRGHEALMETAGADFDYIFVGLSNQRFLDAKMRKSKDPAKVITFNEQERLDMMLEMTFYKPDVLIWGIEEGYTYNVLSAVKEKYGAGFTKKLYFAIGSDKLDEMHRWGYSDKLLSEFGYYVSVRGGDSISDTISKCHKLFKSEFIVKEDDEKYKDLSSTGLRNLIYKKGDYSGYVSEYLYPYLKNKFGDV